MNPTEIPIQHRDLINRLFKSGEVMLPQLTSNDVELLHAAIGIAGKAAELEKAVFQVRLHQAYAMSNIGQRKHQAHEQPKAHSPWDGCDGAPGIDVENIVEELSDHLFYEGALRIAANLEQLAGENEVCDVPEWSLVNGPMMCISLGESRKRVLCELISLHSIFAGDILDVIKKKVMYRKELNTAKLQELLLKDCWVIQEIANVIGVSEGDIREHNINKLEKGPNARYKAGYTDAAAQQRADKEGAE